MTRIRVFDLDAEGNLVSVTRMWESMVQALPSVRSDAWEVSVSYGYGEAVCRLEAETAVAPVCIKGEELEGILRADNLFYDLSAHGLLTGIRFGVKDSTYLFLDAPDEQVIAAVARNYRDVR